MTGKSPRRVPVRRCTGCMNGFPKDLLFRIAKSGGKAVYDEKCLIQSRGAYVCRNPRCIAKAIKTGRAGRSIGADASEVLAYLSVLAGGENK